MGVHKKTCNIAILSETGKYPIAIKIFKAVVKYWLRLHSSERGLILEAKAMNEDLYQKKGQNWNRMVEHLLTLTKIGERPSQNQKFNNKILNNFKKNINELFTKWWQQKKLEGGGIRLLFCPQKKVLDTKNIWTGSLGIFANQLLVFGRQATTFPLSYLDIPKTNRKGRKGSVKYVT